MKADDPELAAALAAVAEHAQDDAAKQVLADLLLERGDDRGEFLLIQFLIATHRASGALRRRADELWARHHRAWMEGADRVLSNVRLVRGFPFDAELLPRPIAELDEALRSPMMATLHTLRVEGSSTGHSAAVVHVASSPRLRNLRALHLRAFDDLRAIAARAPAASLEQLTVGGPAVLSPNDAELIATAPALSALRRLVVAPPSHGRSGVRGPPVAPLVERLARHPRLEALVLAAPWGSVHQCFDELRTLWPRVPFKHLEVGGTLELRREPDGTVVFLQNLEVRQLLGLRGLAPKDTVRAILAPRGRTWEQREALVKAWAPIAISVVP